MLTTAIATAVTLTFTPIMSCNSAFENTQIKDVIWANQSVALRSNIQIADVISLAGERPDYYLSKAEQGALKRALLRSVRIIEPRLA
jgi:hypothetical protein